MTVGTVPAGRSSATAAAHYVDAHQRLAANGGAAAPVWLQELRAGAIARFRELGFPSTQQEDWRFTSVGPIVEAPFDPASAASIDAGALDPLVLGGVAPHRLVFINGHFAAELSRRGELPAGVRLESLRSVATRDSRLLEAHLGRVAGYADHAFGALNTAFVEDGAFVHIGRGVRLAEPIELLFLTVPGAAPSVAHPRSLIIVEREAAAALVETYAAVAGGRYWTNAVTEIVAGEGAHVDAHRIQREDEGGFHTATTESWQARDSTVNLHLIAFGSALARHDVRARLQGPGATAVVNGLYVVAGRQHVDHHTIIDHQAPRCESHEYFNGVLDARARGVFNGRIIVRPGAQRTDSKQTNNNMLLSAEARADSQPQLEIYADDVKCTHGSTTGPLDERHVFYLRSRGMSTEAARQLLTYGFATEILERMEIAPLREQLDQLVRRRVWG